MKDTSTKDMSTKSSADTGSTTIPDPDDVSDLGSVCSAATNTTTSTSASGRTTACSNSFAKQEYVNPKVALKEQKRVVYAKCAVAGVLLVAMASLSAATFVLIQRGEYQNFTTQVSS